MKKYEYNDITVMVPEGWHEITLATYDLMWNIKPQTARDRANVVAIACGVDLQIFLDWPHEAFAMVLQDVKYLFTDNEVPEASFITIGAETYHVAIEQKLTFAEYIDVCSVQSEPKYANTILSCVLAIVCRPAGEKYDANNIDERAKLFGALTVSQVQPVLGFFLRAYQISTRRTALLRDLRAMVDQLPANTRSLLRIGGFIKLSRIWQVMTYYVLMRCLRARLRKFSRS
jgi:hypothetical protein